MSITGGKLGFPRHRNTRMLASHPALNSIDSLLIESEHHSPACDNHRTANQIRLFRHHSNSRFARRWMVLHFLRAVKLVARVQKLNVVAVADQFLKFLGAQPLSPQVAKLHTKTAFFHIRSRFTARCAGTFMQKLNFLSRFCRSTRLFFRSFLGGHGLVPLAIPSLQYRGTAGSISAAQRSIPPAIDRAPSTPCERSHAAASRLLIPWWQNSTISSAASSRARFAGISRSGISTDPSICEVSYSHFSRTSTKKTFSPRASLSLTSLGATSMFA